MTKNNTVLKVLETERNSIRDMMNRQQEFLSGQEKLVAQTKQDIVNLKLDLEEVERAIELLTTGAKPGKNKAKKSE
jgi:hypothetical protein